MPPPDQGRTGHLGKIPQTQLRNRITKGRAIPVERVGRQPARWHILVLEQVSHQLDGQFRFGFERQLGWYADLVAQAGLLVSEPAFGHKQLSSEQRVAFATGVAKIDANLAIGELAQRAAVLMCDRRRVLALFGHTRFIDQDDRILLTQGLGHQKLVTIHEWRSAPGAFTNEGLHTTDWKAMRYSHGFDRFARMVAHQSLKVAMRPRGLILS